MINQLFTHLTRTSSDFLRSSSRFSTLSIVPRSSSVKNPRSMRDKGARLPPFLSSAPSTTGMEVLGLVGFLGEGLLLDVGVFVDFGDFGGIVLLDLGEVVFFDGGCWRWVREVEGREGLGEEVEVEVEEAEEGAGWVGLVALLLTFSFVSLPLPLGGIALVLGVGEEVGVAGEVGEVGEVVEDGDAQLDLKNTK